MLTIIDYIYFFFVYFFLLISVKKKKKTYELITVYVSVMVLSV